MSSTSFTKAAKIGVVLSLQGVSFSHAAEAVAAQSQQAHSPFAQNISEVAAIIRRSAEKGALSQRQYTEEITRCIDTIYESFVTKNVLPQISNDRRIDKLAALQNGFLKDQILFVLGGSPAAQGINILPTFAQITAPGSTHAGAFKLPHFPELDDAFNVSIPTFEVVRDLIPGLDTNKHGGETLGKAISMITLDGDAQRAIVLFTALSAWLESERTMVLGNEVGNTVGALLTDGTVPNQTVEIRTQMLGKTVQLRHSLLEVQETFSDLVSLPHAPRPALFALNRAVSPTPSYAFSRVLSAITLKQITELPVVASILSAEELAQVAALNVASLRHIVTKIDAHPAAREEFREKLRFNLASSARVLSGIRQQVKESRKTQK